MQAPAQRQQPSCMPASCCPNSRHLQGRAPPCVSCMLPSNAHRLCNTPAVRLLPGKQVQGNTHTQSPRASHRTCRASRSASVRAARCSRRRPTRFAPAPADRRPAQAVHHHHRLLNPLRWVGCPLWAALPRPPPPPPPPPPRSPAAASRRTARGAARQKECSKPPAATAAPHAGLLRWAAAARPPAGRRHVHALSRRGGPRVCAWVMRSKGMLDVAAAACTQS